jgi:hypothetical protein
VNEKKIIILNTVNFMTLINLQLAQNSYFFKNFSFLTGAQGTYLQRVTIPEAAYIQLRHGPPEDEQGNPRNM